MLRCRICNNLTADDLPVEKSSYDPSCTKSFIIEKQARGFEDSAALGCATCHMILQAILRYIDTVGSELSLSNDKLGRIVLRGDCNEPLKVSFQTDLRFTDIELFEERQNLNGNYASLYPAVGLGSTPSEVLDIDFAARLASQWISHCDNEHKCIDGDAPLVPSRLLDITSDSVKLVAPTASTVSRYAALSYCWGESGNLTTTSENLDERNAEIIWDDLPNLIQDVIQITRQLGIPYLWVDALCIIQDDRSDWRAESSKMGDIYACAYLTIAADAATDTSCRLTSSRNFTVRSSRRKPRPPREMSGRMRDKKRIEAFPPLVVGGRTHSFCVREPWEHGDIIEDSTTHNLTSPLNTRGWALQERLFSNRVLHFAAHEMIWECKASLNCECEGILQSSDWADGKEFPKASFETTKAIISSHMLQHPDFATVWAWLVSAYSARRLSFESDRLPAISALARLFSRGRTYLAGLWADNLPWHLVWGCDKMDERWFKMDETRPKSTTLYSGPTWSWASTTEEVSWPSWTRQAGSRIQVLEASTAPMDLNEFGEVSWGRIRLKARVAVARISGFRPRLVTSCGDSFHVQPDVGGGVSKSGSDQRTLHDVADHEDVWCLLLFDDVVEHDDGIRDRSLWVMVAAKPNDKSIRRARLDPDAHKDIIICERIGYMSRLNWLRESEKAWTWIDGTDFMEKEVIMI